MARFHLQLSDEEFYSLTPRQFHKLLDRHKEKAEYDEYLHALIAATIANYSFSPPKKAARPLDFMASRREAQPVKKTSPPRKLIAQQVRCFLMARLDQEKPNGD